MVDARQRPSGPESAKIEGTRKSDPGRHDSSDRQLIRPIRRPIRRPVRRPIRRPGRRPIRRPGRSLRDGPLRSGRRATRAGRGNGAGRRARPADRRKPSPARPAPRSGAGRGAGARRGAVGHGTAGLRPVAAAFRRRGREQPPPVGPPRHPGRLRHPGGAAARHRGRRGGERASAHRPAAHPAAGPADRGRLRPRQHPGAGGPRPARRPGGARRRPAVRRQPAVASGSPALRHEGSCVLELRPAEISALRRSPTSTANPTSPRPAPCCRSATASRACSGCRT